MRDVAGFLASTLGTALDPILWLVVGLAAGTRRSIGGAVAASIAGAFVVELILILMTMNDPFGGYRYGQGLPQRVAAALLLGLPAYGIGNWRRRRHASPPGHRPG